MYSEKFLRSLGLDEWLSQQEPQTCKQVSATQDKSALSVSGRDEKKPPRICINCQHSNHFDWCSLNKAKIENLDAETDCPYFKILRCGEGCGFYENGLCCFRDAEIPKNPDDECEFDIREFM